MNTPANKPSNRIFYLFLLVLAIPLCWSCGDVRKLQYMQGQFDTTKLSQVKYPEPVVQVNEMVTINVYSDDPRASAYYNLPPTTTVSNTSETTSGLPSSMGP